MIGAMIILIAALASGFIANPFFSEGNGLTLKWVPIYDDRELKGMLVAVYPIETLLNNLCPGGLPKNTS
jgi:hypothetical protein